VSNKPQHEEVTIALENMIDLAGFSMDVLTGTDAGRAELQIDHAKSILAQLKES
jgi:hypothetical protein